MSDPLIGNTIGGCEVLEIIGQGGMGIIYKARQKSLDRIVAMKVLSPKFTDDVSFVVRFQREARAIARVNHQNILAVYDVGSEDSVHYMIMELIEGESLAELQDRTGGPLKIEDACNYVLQSAQGLEAAQAAGVTHRDIKPENLMVTKKGIIKVSDFGLAKEADAGVTSTDAVMGTPAFMSPEQCDGKKVDGRTDIYSLGASFYRLITGRLPFEAETAMSMMYRHKHEALVPPKEICPAIPQSISGLITRMMHKKREHRPQTMTEVVEGIREGLVKNVTPAPQKKPNPPPRQPPAARATPANPKMDLTGGVPKGQTAIFDAPPPGVSGRMEPLPTGVTGRLPRQPAGVSGRMPAAGPSGRGSDNFSRPGMSSLGRGGTSDRKAGLVLGGDATTDGRILVSRGDELLNGGDRIAGLKCYRDALLTSQLDPKTRQRIDQEVQAEIQTRQQASQNLLQRGMLVEAGRELRILLDLDDNNETAKTDLKNLEEKLASKRTIVNDIRTAIAGLKFEEALQLWDRSPPDLRDEGLSKQIDHLRKVIVPSLNLCEKGESYAKEGRLEEAVAAFQDAIRLDENCERARQGLKDNEGKLQRIDIMMREGYELSLQQDFAGAVEIWLPILKIRPGHPQAIKSIVDAYMTIGQDKKGKGDLKGALKAISSAQEADPQNKALNRKFEEIVDLHDKELALTDRAKEASLHGRKGEAIRYWQEVLRVNPANKEAGPAMDGLKSERTKSLAFTGFLAVSGLALAGLAFQFWTEFAAVKLAEELSDERSYKLAIDVLEEPYFLFYKVKAQDLVKSLTIENFTFEVENCVTKGDLAGAAEVCGNAADSIEDERLSDTFRQNQYRYGAQAAMKIGEQALQDRQWDQARTAFKKAKKILKKAKTEKEIGVLIDRADKRILFVRYFKEALKFFEEGKRKEGLKALDMASKVAIKEPTLMAMIEKERNNQGLDAGKYKEEFDKAVSHLLTPWIEGTLISAEKHLKEAEIANPNKTELKLLKRYLTDTKSCDAAGMVLVTDQVPGPKLRWQEGERKAAFCIDRYEFPNRKGGLPLAGKSLMEAQALCEQKEKALCSQKEWENGCKYKRFGDIWTFGDALIEKACNWKSTGAQPSGAFKECHNTIGAFDMSGNLAEWTQEGNQAGGSFLSDSDDTRCRSKKLSPDKKGRQSIGFRCCKPLK